MPADGGKLNRSSIKNNKDHTSSADREKRGSTPDQSVDPLSLSRFPAFAEDKNKINSYGAESTNEEQNSGGSSSAVAEDVLKTAEVAENDQDDRPASVSRSAPVQVTASNSTGPQPAAEPALTLAQVNPTDYSPIAGGPLIEPCPICGGRVVHYTERFQARQARGPKERSRHICRNCYNKARAREQAAVQILPGAIPLDEVEPIDAGLLGRCSVCGLQVAAYNHAGSGTAICSVCYEKLMREQVDIR